MHAREHGGLSMHGTAGDGKMVHSAQPPIVPGVFQYSDRERGLIFIIVCFVVWKVVL